MKKQAGTLYTSPLVLWMSLFFIIPLSIILVFGFLKKGLYGGVEPTFSLEAYQALANPVLLRVTWATLYISVIATLFIIVLALPTAYFIARSRHKNALLFLIIIPFWTNFLIRIYAWIAILGNNGFLNHLLLHLGILKEPFQFLYNPIAIMVVIVYTYLPFAILPLYSTIEKFDFSLLEAAQDLGATKLQSILKVMIPSIKAGIFSAILFTFIPAFGQYAIPQLVGGNSAYMVGNIIARELTITRNWPLSSAISTLLTMLTFLGVMLFMLQTKRGTQKVAPEPT